MNQGQSAQHYPIQKGAPWTMDFFMPHFFQDLPLRKTQKGVKEVKWGKNSIKWSVFQTHTCIFYTPVCRHRCFHPHLLIRVKLLLHQYSSFSLTVWKASDSWDPHTVKSLRMLNLVLLEGHSQNAHWPLTGSIQFVFLCRHNLCNITETCSHILILCSKQFSLYELHYVHFL